MWGGRRYVFVNICRLLHQSAVSSSSVKSDLSKLRKKTGFSFINCKKALEKFHNDIEKAEAWLKEQAQKEGWSKATKLKDRATAQGVIGLMCQDHCATMVEVNCETDFVARNTKFQHFVGQVVTSAMAECKKTHSSSENVLKKHLSQEDLKNISSHDDKTLGEHLVLAIGQIGENMSLRRGLFMRTSDPNTIGSYVHSALTSPKIEQSSKFSLGKYAALVVFRKTGEVHSGLNPTDLGRRLSQHVVGMNPLRIGEYTPPTAEELEAEKSEENEETDKQSESEEKVEEEMLKQEYLLDPNLTVGDFLLEENVEVLDFARYECGEQEGTT